MARKTLSLLVQRLLSAGLLVVCAAAALWLVLEQQHRDTAAATRAKSALRVFDIQRADAVTHISLQTPTNGSFELVRDGQGDTAWHLVAPTAVLAEASSIESILKSALQLEQTQLVSPGSPGPQSATDLSIFGLSPPRFVLSLTCGGAVGATASTQTLAIGKRNTFDRSLFVQREGAQNVAIVPGEFLSVVDRNLYQLRDKRVALIDAAHIKRLVVAAHNFGPGYALERADDGFYLQKPISALADTEQVEALITALTSLRGKSVVAEAANQTQLSLFGLQSPRFVVSVWRDNQDAAEKPSTQLHFGEIQMRGVTHTFARSNDDAEPVWELGSDWVMQKLRQDAQTLRDMRVVHVDPDKIAQLTVRTDAGAQHFARTHGADGAWQPWHLSGNPNQAIHPSLVAALVARVVHLKADKIVEEHASAKALRQCGLHKPHFEVDLLDDNDHLLASLLMGTTHKDGVFVTTDNKQRLDQIALRAHDEIAAAPQTYFDTDATP